MDRGPALSLSRNEDSTLRPIALGCAHLAAFGNVLSKPPLISQRRTGVYLTAIGRRLVGRDSTDRAR